MLARLHVNATAAASTFESESARLYADAALAGAAAQVAPRRHARRSSFGLDPRLRAADLRAMAREAAGRELAP